MERPRLDTSRQRLGLRDRDPRGKVYAGGNFVNAGGKAAADYLAVFDGVSWKPFCNTTARAAFGAGFQVLALQVVGSTLYVGGSFQNANGDKRADYLIGCNLATGTPSVTVDTDGDFTGAVYDLTATSDGTLYAGGTFTNLDGDSTADGVASYNGAWHGLGTTAIGGIVRGLHARGMDVYISSDGVNIGGIAQADHLVKWNGSAYSAVGASAAGTNGYFPATTYINALTTSGSLLFAAGSWQNADGKPTGDVIASFNGRSWQPSARTAPEAGRGSAIRRRWRCSAGRSTPAARSPAPGETRKPTSPRRGRSGSLRAKRAVRGHNVRVARILLGITGGIAAYKACELVRLLVKAGHDVLPLPTRGAERFVRAETFFALARKPQSTDPYPHLERADLLVIAPLTANTLAKLAHGLADDVLTEAALAHRGPGARRAGDEHAHVGARGDAGERRHAAGARRRADRPRGRRARRGRGRARPDERAGGDRARGSRSCSEQVLIQHKVRSPARSVLVSAGGTREPLDAVRFLGNRSSGRMGVALAARGEAPRREGDAARVQPGRARSRTASRSSRRRRPRTSSARRGTARAPRT